MTSQSSTFCVWQAMHVCLFYSISCQYVPLNVPHWAFKHLNCVLYTVIVCPGLTIVRGPVQPTPVKARLASALNDGEIHPRQEHYWQPRCSFSRNTLRSPSLVNETVQGKVFRDRFPYRAEVNMKEAEIKLCSTSGETVKTSPADTETTKESETRQPPTANEPSG